MDRSADQKNARLAQRSETNLLEPVFCSLFGHCNVVSLNLSRLLKRMHLRMALSRSNLATAQIQYSSIRASKVILVIKAARVYVDPTERRLAHSFERLGKGELNVEQP